MFGWWSWALDTDTEKVTQLLHIVGGRHCSSSSEMDIKLYLFHTVRIRMLWLHFTTYCQGFHPKIRHLLFSVLPLLVRSFRGKGI